MSTSTLTPLAPISAAQLTAASTGMKLDLCPTYGTPSQRFTRVEQQRVNKRWHLKDHN